MFETVAPQASESRSRSALYEALTFSLCVHALAGLIALGANLWEVSFPAASPAAMISFVLSAPDPPPPPPPAAKPLAQPETIETTTTIPQYAFLAPNVIPDEIPLVKPNAFRPADFAVANGVIGGVAGGEDFGVFGGVVGGSPDGVAGGTKDSVGSHLDDERVHIPRDKKLPLTPMSQVYPIYPESARLKGWEDIVVVRYVIGKDGRVKEVTVVQKPDRDVFIDATVTAIASWRFKPFMKDGQPLEVVHELTVLYRLE